MTGIKIYDPNILLIIGNGFDLACGLKSRYIDFYNAEIKGKYDIESWDSKPLNFWRYLLSIHEKGAEDNNWRDIEKIIKEVLEQIMKESNKRYVSISKSAWLHLHKRRRFTPIYKAGKGIENHMFNFCVSCLLGQGVGLSKKGKIISDKSYLCEFLFCGLNTLERQFCAYLKNQVTVRYMELADIFLAELFYKDIYKVSLEKLKTNGLSKIHDDYFTSKSQYGVISFNYTNNPLHSAKRYKKYIKYTNVHGSMCNKECSHCKNSSAIFGIDDTVIANNTTSDMRMFSKTYRTLQLAKDYNSQQVLPTKEKLLIIRFFGHSLSEADYSYFQSIFDHYDIYSNTNVVLEFLYTNYKDKNNIYCHKGELHTEHADAVYKLINQYGISMASDKGKNLMHKLILEKRIKVLDIT